MISTLLVLWLCIPLSVWIKPNGNVAPINESAIIGRPVGCTISFKSRFIHFEIIGLNKPYRLGLCNKAPQDTNAGNNKQVDWTEFMQIWYQQSYDTNDNATKSTTKVESFLKSKRIPSQSIKACPDAIKENSNENKTVESKKRIQVQDISGLIKRKKKT